jgi:hypothetical protein
MKGAAGLHGWAQQLQVCQPQTQLRGNKPPPKHPMQGGKHSPS